MNKDQLKQARRICSREVREINCNKCLHFATCNKLCIVASNLGRYIAWLNMEALPPIENEMNEELSISIELEAHVANSYEAEAGAYAVVRAYVGEGKRRVLFSLQLKGDESTEDMRKRLYNAYRRKYCHD